MSGKMVQLPALILSMAADQALFANLRFALLRLMPWKRKRARFIATRVNLESAVEIALRLEVKLLEQEVVIFQAGLEVWITRSALLIS